MAFQEFPKSIVEAHGRPALEAIESMSGKRVPGQVWQKISPLMTAAGDSGDGDVTRPESRVTLLMDQYKKMLRFLGEKGCLVNSIRPEVITWFHV